MKQKQIWFLVLPLLLISSLLLQSYVSNHRADVLVKDIQNSYFSGSRLNGELAKLLVQNKTEIEKVSKNQPIINIEPLFSSADDSNKTEWCDSLWWQYMNPEQALTELQIFFLIEFNELVSFSAKGYQEMVLNMAIASSCEL